VKDLPQKNLNLERDFTFPNKFIYFVINPHMGKTIVQRLS